jgi:uncharacterized protein (TIGR02996 family)
MTFYPVPDDAALSPETDWRRWHLWLDALRDAPADALTYLAFADWLAEQGWHATARHYREVGQAFLARKEGDAPCP